MTANRHTIANALRQCRGSRNATARAAIRHGRNIDALDSLSHALALLNVAERELKNAARIVRGAKRGETR